MRKHIAVAACVLAGGLPACGGGSTTKTIIASISITSSAEQAGAPFGVLSFTSYVDVGNTFAIDGEVRNSASRTAGQITVTVSLRDAKQRLITVPARETTGLRSSTPAGETTPFSYRLPNGAKLRATISTFDLSATGEGTDMQPVMGLVVQNPVASSQRGNYQLAGRLTNAGSAAVTSPELVATFYNASGQVVRARVAVFSADSFAPGEGDIFTFGIPDDGQLGITRYALAPQAGR